MTFKGLLKFIVLLLFMGCLNAQLPAGEALIDSMINSIEIKYSSSIIEQVNEYSDGKKRTFQFHMYSGNKGEMALMRYTLPSSVRGQTFLMLNNGDEIWTFSPRTRRVRKLASHYKKQKVQGSDFTFEDFSSQDSWKNDYLSTTTGTEDHMGVPCWSISSKARSDADSDYSEIRSLIRKSDYYPLHISYYLPDGSIEKTMEFKDIRNYDGIPNADLVIMTNHITNTRTIMRTLEFDPHWKGDPEFFSERNLKK